MRWKRTSRLGFGTIADDKMIHFFELCAGERPSDVPAWMPKYVLSFLFEVPFSVSFEVALQTGGLTLDFVQEFLSYWSDFSAANSIPNIPNNPTAMWTGFVSKPSLYCSELRTAPPLRCCEGQRMASLSARCHGIARSPLNLLLCLSLTSKVSFSRSHNLLTSMGLLCALDACRRVCQAWLFIFGHCIV